MTFYAKSDYVGRIPDSEWLENYPNGWGNYGWPGGVPGNLLGNAVTADGTVIQVRAELVPLVQTLVKITEEKLGYKMTGGGYTGGYSNRPIAGTKTPSAHSRARAIDINAQSNPQSWTFQCDIPPAVIALWTSHGFYWGGWYIGVAMDTMHLSYNRPPGEVAAHLASATAIYGSAVPVAPAPPAPPPAPVSSAPAFPLGGGQIFGLWNQPGARDDGVAWAKLTRSGDDRWDGNDIRTWVAMIQDRLNHYYTSDSPALAKDGYFGAATSRDAGLFQQLKGLAVDGMVGPQTWQMLWS